MNAIDYFESLDSCITDACAFLRIERRDFFALARRWPHYVSQFKTFDKPEDFYRAFQDDRGRSNVCANILDQLGRIDLASLLEQLPVSSETVGPLILADIGCGTTAQSFDMAQRFGAAYLVDLPNLAQEFVAWRCRHHALAHVHVGTMADIATPVHVMLCIDVLEHIAQASAFFLQMDRLLSRGGVLVLRVPWASMAPHPEHLPEAEAD
ncbi:MAG: hypothetical protein FD153_1998 [Rhodospirillaceae bacterium]|nr:MAG: hypothetical protein FD153_1998 [Rhodospirillaceae bacterium]